jgi:chromosome segregation ATPase
MHKRIFLFLLIVVAVSLRPVSAQEATEAEIKLRENLRNTMIQLRDAQGKIAALEGTQLQNEQKIKSLESELEKTKRKASDEGQAATARIEALETDVAQQDERNAKQVEALGKWKKAFDQLSAAAQTTESKRVELAGKVVVLQRKVDEQKQTNWNLYKKFGLGDALLAREPFVGTTRVKFQNLIQDYSDQLTDNRIRE